MGLAETREQPGANLAEPSGAGGAGNPSSEPKPGRTRWNAAEPGGTRRHPLERGGTLGNPAAPGGTRRNPAEKSKLKGGWLGV